MAFNNKYMDGEKLFTAYWKEFGGSVTMGGGGTYQRLANWAAANGMRNPVTGKTPTRMAAWKSCYRFAVNNVDKAYEIAKTAFVDRGMVLTKERWMAEMRMKAQTSYQKPNFTRKWEQKNAS